MTSWLRDGHRVGKCKTCIYCKPDDDYPHYQGECVELGHMVTIDSIGCYYYQKIKRENYHGR